MAWEIAWIAGTHERLRILARERLRQISLKHAIGDLAVQRVEQEIKMHPLPSPDLPQISEDGIVNFGSFIVGYHIDSATMRAEVKEITVRQKSG